MSGTDDPDEPTRVREPAAPRATDAPGPDAPDAPGESPEPPPPELPSESPEAPPVEIPPAPEPAPEPAPSIEPPAPAPAIEPPAPSIEPPPPVEIPARAPSPAIEPPPVELPAPAAPAIEPPPPAPIELPPLRPPTATPVEIPDEPTLPREVPAPIEMIAEPPPREAPPLDIPAPIGPEPSAPMIEIRHHLTEPGFPSADDDDDDLAAAAAARAERDRAAAPARADSAADISGPRDLAERAALRRPTSRPGTEGLPRAGRVGGEVIDATAEASGVHAAPRPPAAADPAAPAAPAADATDDARADSADADAARPASEDDDAVDDETAAQWVGRRFLRATTDLIELGEELRGQYRQHDGLVIALALAIVFAAGLWHRRLVTPDTVAFDEHGLTFARSTAWLAPEPTPLPAPRLVPGVVPARPREGALPYHVVFTSALEADARLEVYIDDRPAWSNLLTGLELDRRTRYGELYAADAGAVRSIAGQAWLRTEYHYAFAPEPGDVPRIGHAVEYATVDREHLYVVTMHGSAAETDRIEEVTAPSLRVESRTGMPPFPEPGRLARTTRPGAIDQVFASTVMVVVVDVDAGRLRAAGGGSGVIIGADGSILTNYHVLRAGKPPAAAGDPPPRLHDLFLIGRFAGNDKPPQLVCAGRPSRAKLDPVLDLALIKCDTDLDGRAWSASSVAWPALATPRAPDVRPGQRLWVLGYPDVGGGGLTLTQGLVEGWSGADGALGRDYLKTDAPITHGNSGGPVVDDDGHLIGLATAFRTRVTADGGVVETAKVGLVRPLAAAADAIAIVRAGWTPREGHNTFELEPVAVEAPAEGVYLSTKVVDAANDAPVPGALLMVLRPGVGAGEIDMNRLDEQVVSWGRVNADGEVHLKQPVPVPGTYTVLVVARGYEPLVGDHELRLADDTPPFYDPWGVVRIQAR